MKVFKEKYDKVVNICTLNIPKETQVFQAHMNLYKTTDADREKARNME